MMRKPTQSSPPWTGVRLRAWLACLAVLLAGCAQLAIHDRSTAELAQGNYEGAIATLEQGVKAHPESTLLRTDLLRAREEGRKRVLSEAMALRSGGDTDGARRALERARSLTPGDERIDALLHELDREARQRKALREAEELVARRRPDAAAMVVEEALKHNPRQAALLALQRRLEIDSRQARTRAARSTLAEQRPVSLDFRDANLRTVLDVVSRDSGINFVLDRDIRTDIRVTVHLRQTRLEDALDLLVGTNQLAKKVIDAQTVLIYPNTPEKRREYQEQIVRVFYLASAEAKGAAAFLRSMLAIREPYVDERTNMLSIRDSLENVQLAERLVALYDAGEPEVLLEVEVLEVSSTRLTELGVRFPDSFTLTPLAPADATGLTLGNVRGINSNRIGLGIGGLTVNLRREIGDFNTLANPRIRARNKEKANILIGDKIPVITTTTSTGGFVSDSISYLDVGLKLEVEPTVHADDEVAVKIALEVSSLGTAIRTTSGALAYQIGTRNASTLLRLADGETQLLAGLISREERTTASRVPGVGDLPMLGRLFSSQRDNGLRTELVLAITPRVLRNIRRPDANETELWVGTDALPRLQRPTAGMDVRPAQAARAGSRAPGAADAAPRGAAPAERAAPVLQWAAPGKAKVGDTVEVGLQLTSLTELRGLPMTLTFDPNRLQWLGATEGDFFRQDGAATSFTQSLEGDDGRVRVGTLRNESRTIGGQGRVATLRFKAIGSGEASVRMEQAIPIAPRTGAGKPLELAPLTVVIE